MTVSEKHMATARGIGSRWWCSHCRCRPGLECQPVKEAAAALASAEREGMMRAVRIIREGYPRPVAVPYRKDGMPSKHDKCAHGFYMIEDCEECAISAILSQANTHSPDPSSHQVNSPASSSSPEPGTHSSRSALSAGSDGNPSKPSPADGCVKMDGASPPAPDRPDAKSACIRAEAGQAVTHSHASRNGEG